MRRAVSNSTAILPLFVWPEQTEIAALETERADLARRINGLPRFAHRRVALEARLRASTERQLQLECAIQSKARPQ